LIKNIFLASLVGFLQGKEVLLLIRYTASQAAFRILMGIALWDKRANDVEKRDLVTYAKARIL
jgi:hypothetical protein